MGEYGDFVLEGTLLQLLVLPLKKKSDEKSVGR